MIWYDEETTIKLKEIINRHPEWYEYDDKGYIHRTKESPEELEHFFQFLNEQKGFEEILSNVFKK